MYDGIWVQYGVEEAQQISMEEYCGKVFILNKFPTYMIDLNNRIQTNVTTDFQRLVCYFVCFVTYIKSRVAY